MYIILSQSIHIRNKECRYGLSFLNYRMIQSEKKIWGGLWRDALCVWGGGGVLDLPIGIDILMNLQTHQGASARAHAYAHGDYTNCPLIQDVMKYGVHQFTS